MQEFLLTHLSGVYALMFALTFCVVALWESAAPRRAPGPHMGLRWFSNGCLLATTSAVYWLLLPASGVASSIYAIQQGWGLFQYLYSPEWAALLGTLLLLDLGHYAIHRLMHRVPFLWRLHRVHHTDHDFDVTTAVRFHPLEAALEASLYLVLIFVLGPPVLAVVLFHFTFVMSNFWVHGNLRMPGSSDRYLRGLFITPDMHRVHHSREAAEAESNYGGIFSIWDHLFGTYTAEPAAGHQHMGLGLPGYGDPKHLRVDYMLANPFMAEPSSGTQRPRDGQLQSSAGAARLL